MVALATLVATSTVSSAALASRQRTVIEKIALRSKVAKRQILTNLGGLLEGTKKVGPKHTLHAIKEKPARYALMLTTLAIAGGAAKAMGIDPTWYAVGLSGGTYAWAAWKSLPGILAAKGRQRFVKIGADLVWPAGLVALTTAGGMVLGHGQATEVRPSVGEILRAGAQTTVITVDIPTIAQTVLDAPAKKPEKVAAQ